MVDKLMRTQNDMKYIKFILAISLVATLAATAQVSVGTGTQVGGYSFTLLSVPTGALTTEYYVTNSAGTITTNTVPYYTAGTTATNLAAGWNTTNIYTNITILWNSSSNAFVTNTTYSTNISTKYCDFSALGNQNAGLSFSWDGATNVTFTVAKSVDGVNFDTNAMNVTTYNFTNNTFPSGVMGTYVANLSMGGVGYGRVTKVLVTGTLHMTNPVIRCAAKRNAP